MFIYILYNIILCVVDYVRNFETCAVGEVNAQFDVSRIHFDSNDDKLFCWKTSYAAIHDERLDL